MIKACIALARANLSDRLEAPWFTTRHIGSNSKVSQGLA
ncbi:unnamed protein product [Acidithrix sp. C25]|nr:unnamed protein product [Acidithrix sp. C25]